MICKVDLTARPMDKEGTEGLLKSIGEERMSWVNNFHSHSHFLQEGRSAPRCDQDGYYTGVSRNSRSRPFPRMKASDSYSRIMGMDFFIPFPFPNFGNGFFLFPSRSRISGMDFFHSLPVPKLTLSKSGIKRENGRF